MDILAMTRKAILCVGLLASALLFLYPHWRGSFDMKRQSEISPIFDYDLGRDFITTPPAPNPDRLAELVGWHEETTLLVAIRANANYRIHHARQFTEVALALLFTFGLMWALRKPAGV